MIISDCYAWGKGDPIYVDFHLFVGESGSEHTTFHREYLLILLKVQKGFTIFHFFMIVCLIYWVWYIQGVVVLILGFPGRYGESLIELITLSNWNFYSHSLFQSFYFC